MSYNPYLGLSQAKLRGLRRDSAKLLHASVSARKTAERQLTLIAQALRGATDRATEVSDHAVIRYLERVRGMDVVALREEIREAVLAAKPIVGDFLRASDGVIYCISNEGHVTTVLPLDAVVEQAEEDADVMAAKTGSSKRSRSVRAKRAFAEEAKET